jgi:cation diffusion facilitator CzcD-associated flavoprotein CzcO
VGTRYLVTKVYKPLFEDQRYWNCYPGARVDSDTPIYQLFDKELWEGWNFKERYPGWQELRQYFHYLDSKLDLKRDIQFNTACTGARFDEQNNQWVIDLDDGTGIKVRARWFIAAMGFAAKPYTPAYPGLDKFKGEIHHTSVCPPAESTSRWRINGISRRNGHKQVLTSRTSALP